MFLKIATQLRKIAVKGTSTKAQKCKWCKNPAIKSYVWAEGRAYIPTCEKHEDKTRKQIEIKNKDSVTTIREIPQKKIDKKVKIK